MKYKIILLLITIPTFIYSLETTDTLWSVPHLDGGIDYRPGSGIYTMSTTGSSMIIGDGFDMFNQEEVFSREYLSFDLSTLPHPDSIQINHAEIGVYQFRSYGNDTLTNYPIWDVAGGDTHFCVLDHIDYGNSLDLSDWTAGDPGDPKTLATNIGIITDNATVEYKKMNVTPYVIADLDSGRNYNQYRMRFTIDRDFDLLADRLMMISGNATVYPKPFLEIRYDTISSILENQYNPNDFQLFQNYPNPFNSITQIEFLLDKHGYVECKIFDISGQLVVILLNSYKPAGVHKIKFNADNLSSSVYYYRLEFNHRQSLTRKMLLIR